LLRQVFPRCVGGSEADRIHFIVECGDWTLIGLDSHVPGAVPGEFDAGQAEWLQQQLSQSAAKRIVLFIHHPPVDVGSLWMDAIGLDQRERLQQIVKADPRVTLICCGHVHHEFQAKLHQALVCTTPSTGIQFSPQGHEATFAAEPPGYRVIELRGTEFTTHVVRLPRARWVPVAD
jgi:Icc protein